MRLRTRILVSVVFGVVATVGAAWGAAVFVPRWGFHPQVLEVDVFWASSSETPVSSVWMGGRPQGSNAAMRRAEPPDWTRLRSKAAAITPSARPYNPTFLSAGYGWPCRALVADAAKFSYFRRGGQIMEVPQQGPWQPSNGFEVPWTDVVLPTRPLWSGLFIDVGVIAAIAYALLFAPRDVRRALRRRRGLCVKCAYPVGGETCPECGKVTG